MTRRSRRPRSWRGRGIWRRWRRSRRRWGSSCHGGRRTCSRPPGEWSRSGGWRGWRRWRRSISARRRGCWRCRVQTGEHKEEKLIDLRSDTVTRPTEGMRRAMAGAALGDDVFGEDPTVNRLEEYVAALLGKEAALYCPSGTMTNQIGVHVGTGRGDEVLLHEDAHIFNYEAGAPAFLSGVQVRPVPGEGGVVAPETLRAAVRPENVHFPRPKLLCLENTHKVAGGKVFPLEEFASVAAEARSLGLKVHLDGARLFNAEVATGIPAREWCEHAETVSVCSSKGLGAPVGSLLAGDEETIREARRIRKAFGGGMRQAGVIAAASLYAFEHHVERLAEDHERAKRLAAGLEA